MPPTDLITSKEACEILQVSRSTIWRYIKKGRLRSFKLPGGQLRLSRSDVAGLLALQDAERP